MFSLNNCQNSINLNKVLYCYLSHQKFKLNVFTLIFFFSQYSTMKFSLLIKITTGMAICTGTLVISAPIEASSNKYSCQEVNGIYGIYSRTERGDMRLMNLKRDVSQDWSIVKRCEEIARRFQRFSDNGILRFIGSGYVSNEPVLCAVIEKGQLCNSENILVTLPAQTDPIGAARKLMDTRGLAYGRVIDVNGKEGKLESYVDGHTYYDLEVLEQLVLQQENSDRLIKTK